MSDRQYVRRRAGLSWHVVRTHTRMQDGWIALCGRRIYMDDAAALDVLPGDENVRTMRRHRSTYGRSVIAVRFLVWWHGLMGEQPVVWQRAIGWVH